MALTTFRPYVSYMFFLQKGNGLVDKLPVVGVETGHVGKCFHKDLPVLQCNGTIEPCARLLCLPFCLLAALQPSRGFIRFQRYSDFLQDEGA